jgi:hypothetical protein
MEQSMSPSMSSTEVPEPIRLDDLAAPRFSDEARAVLEAGAALADQAVLEPDALCATAVEQLGGLDQFGDDAFREPLAVLCDSLRTEAGLSAFGRVSIHAQLVQLLKNRLLVTDHLHRHPEALDVPVRAPIVIAGLPRTGTTHLHNLVSADTALRCLPYWESLEPLPAPGDEPGSIEPRVERCELALSMSELFLPELPRMHEMTAWHAHEEIALLAIDCSTMFFDTLAPMPTWREHYRSSDQTPHYEYLRRVLQVLQHARGGARWVLKSPQHLEQFGPLTEVFPDATFVLTHRDPGDVVVSMTTMIAYTARMHLATVDPVALGAHWTAILTDLLSSCAAQRDLLPAERSLDVRFDDFMADEAGVVGQVYELAGQPLDTTATAAHEQYRSTHRRNRHGAVIYEPDVLGIDPAVVRTHLGDYCDRFGV